MADRFIKIRNSENIRRRQALAGVVRPPIDPAMLVRGSGGGFNEAMRSADSSSALPYYRFKGDARKGL